MFCGWTSFFSAIAKKAPSGLPDAVNCCFCFSLPLLSGASDFDTRKTCKFFFLSPASPRTPARNFYVSNKTLILNKQTRHCLVFNDGPRSKNRTCFSLLLFRSRSEGGSSDRLISTWGAHESTSFSYDLGFFPVIITFLSCLVIKASYSVPGPPNAISC